MERTGRPGAYLRIVRRPGHDVTMRLMMHAALVAKDRLPELLAAPELTDEWRDSIEEHAA